MKFSKVFTAQKHQMNSGLYMYQFTDNALEGLSNPVLQIDYFYMGTPYFKPHPHSSFSAVTYMLESSEGSFINRDSFGDHSEIGPGDIHWTWSASGMMHEEVPKVPGVICNGLQIFVNMPQKFREEKPIVFHLEKEKMPFVDIHGGKVKIVAGEYGGQESPLQLPSPITILDLNLGPQARMNINVPPNFGGLLVHTSGELFAHDNRLVAHQAIGFACRDLESENFSVETRELSGRAVFLMGAQVQDPLYFAGSLAAGSENAIRSAVSRFQHGEMGYLKPSF